jgi:hypothetical protein
MTINFHDLETIKEPEIREFIDNMLHPALNAVSAPDNQPARNVIALAQTTVMLNSFMLQMLLGGKPLSSTSYLAIGFFLGIQCERDGWLLPPEE